jgi:hypothetical protein
MISLGGGSVRTDEHGSVEMERHVLWRRWKGAAGVVGEPRPYISSLGARKVRQDAKAP